MVQPGYDRPDGDAAPKVSGQRARQGQNIKGMIWVLVAGIILVVAAYAIMLALQAKPVTPGNELAAPVADSAPATQETAQSPN